MIENRLMVSNRLLSRCSLKGNACAFLFFPSGLGYGRLCLVAVVSGKMNYLSGEKASMKNALR